MSGLRVGAPAPEVGLRDQHGQTRTLSRERGRSPVVLVFFPAVFSSVCSSELADLRHWWDARDPGSRAVELWGVSCDPMFSLRGYSDSEGIGYPLLSDFWPHGAAARAYDVFDETTGTARRSSYLVDREGRIAWSVHHAPSDARDVAELDRAVRDVPR